MRNKAGLFPNKVRLLSNKGRLSDDNLLAAFGDVQTWLQAALTIYTTTQEVIEDDILITIIFPFDGMDACADQRTMT